MATLASLQASYLAVAAPLRAFGDALLALANPALDRATREAVTAPVNYGGTLDFDVALWLTLAYLLIVAGGAVLRPAKAPTGPSAEGKKDKGPPKPVAQKFRDEPILYLQFVYNWVQVGLCGYMMVTAAQVAVRRGYTLLCNRFDATPRDNELLNVLWIFYVSKVRGRLRVRSGAQGLLSGFFAPPPPPPPPAAHALTRAPRTHHTHPAHPGRSWTLPTRAL